VIGDSEIADKLEDDRVFGIRVMEDSGIEVPPWEQFSDIKTAVKFIRYTNKRYVFKPSGDDVDCAATYVSASAEDLISYLGELNNLAKGADFILQEFVPGTEVSTEGFFNGKDWYFINNTFEEKKFMNDNIGPNTGCSGNLVYSHGINKPRLFNKGLGKLTQFLKDVNYRGMIDLNCIVTDTNCYGLEWTPRFGYDATATQTLLIKGGYGNFLANIVHGQDMASDIFVNAFAASVRVSIPPYPLNTKNSGIYHKDIPIAGIEESDLQYCYLYDVELVGNKKAKDDLSLVTAGHEGFICCPMAMSEDAAYAFDVVKKKIKQIKIPDMQYRTDIEKTTLTRFMKLKNQGWFSYDLEGKV
jgi:phosphoribosylamine-glycine ligase